MEVVLVAPQEIQLCEKAHAVSKKTDVGILSAMCESVV